MEDNEIKRRINELTLEHKDLDDSIMLMTAQPFVDELQIRRIKKRKLKIKDELAVLESDLIPDIEG